MSDGWKEITITVVRQKPGEEQQRLESYRIPYQRGMSVLDALDSIRRLYDPSLAYNHSCRHGKSCRLCVAEINGRVSFMCDVPAADGMVVKPVKNKKVARDLIAWGKKE
ncbi:MAG: 2Fe-2S iron-sulfur cluster-binding protein [Peptococcaceae bacterium]|jgi:succinate dehydrogenase / fumarate reductase iron-sulfur subunit|nr:2Fe-2S iron-sulfur cluster-binding protein [Peptococcaceae bacterium]MDH7526390.1 2Fe-2S iron-sulfur cluster-binding protein [Peptococcaceae bacterium]